MKKVPSSFKFYFDVGREDGREGADSPKVSKKHAPSQAGRARERRKSKVGVKSEKVVKLSEDIASKKLMKRQLYFLEAKGKFIRNCEFSSIT